MKKSKRPLLAIPYVVWMALFVVAPIIMVVIYDLLPIIKNTYTGITGIDPLVLEAASGIGLSKAQQLLQIQYAIKQIVPVDTHQIRPRNPNTALFQDIFLIGHVCDIHGLHFSLILVHG